MIFAGCTSVDESAGNPDCLPDAKTPANCKNGLPKSQYPAAPPALMQAELTKTDGTVFKLEDYKGKVLLVNLWATWCGPCKKEIPEFIRIQTANQEKGFEIIGIDSDDNESVDDIKEFGEKMGINYQLAKSEYKVSYEFIKISKFDAIPQTFLIDREGKLVGVYVGGSQENLNKIKQGISKLLNS